MSVQKVITSNGGEILTARMMRENMALVHEEWHQRGEQLKYHAVVLNPREYWELHDYIEQHGAPRPNVPGYPPAPMQIAGAQGNGETPPFLPNTNGEAGDLSGQPAE